MEYIASENPTFQIVILHPGFMIGPGVSKIPSSSVSAIKDIMNKKFPGVPKIYFPCVDVRDVAWAQIAAMESSIDRERILLSEKVYKFSQLTQILYDEFTSKGCKITNKEMSRCPMATVALFNKEVANLMPLWNVKYETDNSKSIRLLDMKYTDIKTTMIDMGNWLIDRGEIKIKIKK